MRGGSQLFRTPRLRANSNHSAPRAEYRASALAFCPFSILIFFRGGGFELEWGGKKAGRYYADTVMVDVFSKAKRSEVMSLIRSTNTKPEIAFRKLISSTLYPKGYRYRLHYKKLPGKPDMVFVEKKVAVFVDGSFWHGHRLKKGQTNLSRRYWLPKIKRNMERDKLVNRRLRKMGWKVVRVWEHEIRKNPENARNAVMHALKGHS